MVRKKMNINSALELNGASVCVQQGTTTELNLADYFRSNKMKYEVVAFKSEEETVKAYRFRPLRRLHDGCVRPRRRARQARRARRAMILPEIISKEPLASSVRKGDSNGPRSCAGCISPWWTPRKPA